jgi:hypothetical protein
MSSTFAGGSRPVSRIGGRSWLTVRVVSTVSLELALSLVDWPITGVVRFGTSIDENVWDFGC